MKRKKQPMFRENGICIQLTDYLKHIPDNDWLWSFLWFDGIGIAPNNLSMMQFTDQIQENATGFKMTWQQCLEFASTLEQTFDCLLVAVEQLSDLKPNELSENNFSNCLVLIEAFDSTEWTIQVSDSLTDLLDMIE